MIENSKCECGHNNPVGTILCEYCGKPLDEELKEKQTIAKEMRYEGKARRSQTLPASPFDMVWNFFSSVKVAVILILITLVTAGIGSIYPQENLIPETDRLGYYEQHYGFTGKLFYVTGFSHVYETWWFFLLVAMIGISLVVCSLDRVVPLFKALNNQQTVKSTEFISKQRIRDQKNVPAEEKEEKLQQISAALEKKFYRVHRDGDSLLAEKGRISRWGPYINHIGLILFLLGILLRYIPGWYLDETMWVREGEIKRVPETPYYVKNERFSIQFYNGTQSENEGPIVKKYETDAVLYKKNEKNGKLIPVKKSPILVNHPLKYDDLMLYQADFQMGLLDSIKLKVTEKKTGKQMGTFTVDLYNLDPNHVYHVGNLDVRALEYYPDFAMKDNRPITKSQDPNRPAFIFEVKEKGQQEGEKSWVIAGENLDSLTKQNKYAIDLAGLNMVNQSGLLVRVDKCLPFLFVGGFFTMIGLVMGFYWQHRRVWIRWKDGILYVGAHTNKNWYSLFRELKQIESLSEFSLQPVKK
ncbi:MULTISPECIES: cytochrome c biogenesis protein ResB [Thermoactinomyces]|jgi:cytochrome c biogenesis protein|uniref:Cytochrome c biogenesis protein ResB n=1 Tax=Thermoactinomyces daqus TaxID=1329516 RepID=A0A7W1XAP0_9BACL|nr:MULTISPECIES: cytochrome c biogenesis protein ResB [Thermoactinomyces]MBA4543101.1 cytochrome c biogenesis protein ResB [Thermoactinomyces daqus]MBH8596664.1 cytochrome c biogenesis protein ResB [Thermoactinomyces sp. CICC 10523]MBH8603426.1 cytochrome c biogenesis protein ResB [Thermoactinomyces sp. CICC 10522]MBH8609266.1 cytochrome c biogenesis protein ResB [Thermoactinomyces sp. CICC 10521]